MSALALMIELSLIIGKEYIRNIPSFATLCINHYLSLILKVMLNRFPKIVFALSAEHALRAGNIGSRIILDVDVVGLMDETDGLICAMNHTSFGR